MGTKESHQTSEPSGPDDAPWTTPVEQPGASPFPVVGVGASAGGLEAFTQLLQHLPGDTGMAFVLVQHLDPKHENKLASLLAKVTTMPVTEVTEGLAVEPNHVYVIPKNTTMTIAQGVLELVPRGDARGPHLPIDQFFKSLADDQRSGAIGVILSGTGSDGTLGLTEVKAAGGFTFTQDKESAKYYSMPQNAIASGSVDFGLPPQEIAQQLARIGRHPYLAPSQPIKDEPRPGEDEQFQKILLLLRATFSVDFTHYRDTTIKRRTLRRMALHSKETLAEYAQQLEGDRSELEALYQDILINVTSFFRDPAMFEALKTSVFPQITKNKSPQTPLRVWTAGCSTGQEAYSIAMAFVEFLDDKPVKPPIQIFATDLGDTVSLEKARLGLYPESIEADVSPERLRRFFIKEDGKYRVMKFIRDLCVFAKQNLASDPPFSRMDLISCRNVLIYLAPPLQKRVIPTFHYALNPTGFLMLGASETVGAFSDLFAVVDKTHKIYSKKATTGRLYPHFNADAYLAAVPGEVKSVSPPSPTAADLQKEADRIVLGHYSPAGVLVSETLDILQFRGRTSPYLEPAPGTASLNLLKMARDGLFMELKDALAEAKRENAATERLGVRVRDGGEVREVNLKVSPVKIQGMTECCFLVLFEEPGAHIGQPTKEAVRGARLRSSGAPRADSASGWLTRLFGSPHATGEVTASLAPPDDRDRELLQLRRELAAAREHQQLTAEQHDAANDELKSANEEILSANEELQSTNEELETAKEELQSVNEELTTVNEQLQNRNLELNHSNDDLTNLIGSTTIPIVMLGSDLRVRRFTPTAGKVLNLLPTDVGRPVADIKLTVDVPDLEALLEEVIATVRVTEREVQDREGRWYQLRLHPYRTADNKIDGAVLVFFDIDERRQAEAGVHASEVRYRRLFESAKDGILILDSVKCNITDVNPFMIEFLGYSRDEFLGKELWEIGLIKDEESSKQAFEELREKGYLRYENLPLETKPGARREVEVVSNLYRENGHEVIQCNIRDITERKRAEEALKDDDRRKNEFLAMLAHELRNPLAAISNAVHLSDRPDGDADAIEWSRDVVKRQVKNLAHLVDDLLDVARITQGKVQLRNEPVELSSLVARVLRAVHHNIDDRKHELSVSLPQEPVWLNADPTRLEQVFTNLLNNAAKYTEPGGKLEFHAERQGTEVVITVRDSGVGISPEMLPRVFDLFTQVERSSDRSEGGLGIGLTIVRSLVDMHNGSVSVSSTPGEGSVFTVRLPICEEPPPERTEPATSGEVEAPTQRRILIVDDNEDTAETMARLLKRSGHHVETAHDGPSAIDAARDYRPEVMLLDIGLPGMDGYEVAAKLREEECCKDTVIIAVSGYGLEGDRRRSREAGFDHHLVKPVDYDSLAALIGGTH